MQTTLISLEVNYVVDFSYESRPRAFHELSELLISNY